MRYFVLLWVVVEVLQVAVIAALAVGYRNLQRRLEQTDRFERGAPPSVTEG
ncbi:MAG TPA: hypothetical protein VD968_09215 [Pyrinomonadaceae bacterium]|nr:hypothetical protein [Pyrinomonadaceae bacterium]